MIKKNIGLHEKCPLFLSDFNESSIFSTDFWETLLYKISRKCVQSFHPDRQTDMTKLTAALRSFADAPKNRTSKCLKKKTVMC